MARVCICVVFRFGVDVYFELLLSRFFFPPISRRNDVFDVFIAPVVAEETS